jgi:hypothetical protein
LSEGKTQKFSPQLFKPGNTHPGFLAASVGNALVHVLVHTEINEDRSQSQLVAGYIAA